MGSPYSTTSEIFASGGEEYLKEGHTPMTLPERQEEILKLRRSLKPAARGAGAENTLLPCSCLCVLSVRPRLPYLPKPAA